MESLFIRAAEAIRSARSMVITAGAGMGVDSGLPDFRGDRGFWNAYPMYERLGLSFVDAANPAHFRSGRLHRKFRDVLATQAEDVVVRDAGRS